MYYPRNRIHASLFTAVLCGFFFTTLAIADNDDRRGKPGFPVKLHKLKQQVIENTGNIADNFSIITGNTADIAILDKRVADLEEGASTNGRNFVEVNCSKNPDALLDPPINGQFPDDTTYEITGRCNGPLYVTEDRVHFVGKSADAAIVMPGPPEITDPSNGTVFGDGAHDLRIQNLLIDVSNWGSSAIAIGTEAAGVYARNAFVRVIDTRIVGGLYSMNPFRNAIIRTQGTVELVDFVYNGITVGDQSLVGTRGPVHISSSINDSGYLRAVEVYRSGLMDFRRGVTIKIPPENEELGFEPLAINVFQQSQLRIRNSGTVDIQGPVRVNQLGSASIERGTIGGDIDIGGSSNVSLNNVTIEDGGLSVETGSDVTLWNSSGDSGAEIDTGGILFLIGSELSGEEISVGQNSTFKTEDSDTGPVTGYFGATIQLEGGSTAGLELRHGSLADMEGVLLLGDIGLFAPSNLNVFVGDFGSLNGHTIYLCGNSTSFIEPAIAMTGIVEPLLCLP